MNHWLLPAVLVLGACRSTPPPLRHEVDAAVQLLMDRTRVDTPPIDSELMEVADAYVESSTTDGKQMVAVLNVGADAYVARIHAIRAARRTIDLQVFTMDPDDTGNYFFKELVEAAKRGIQVRVLVDQLGLPGGIRLHLTPLVHENLEIRLYNPVGGKYRSDLREFTSQVLSDFGKTNHRMHNKVFVVDDCLGFVGGRNIANRYFDMDPEFNYLDRDALILGPLVQEMTASIDGYWDHELTLPVRYLEDIGWKLIEATPEEVEALRWPEYPRLDWANEQANMRLAADVMPHSPLIEAESVRFYADVPTKRDEQGEYVEMFRGEMQASYWLDDYMILQSNYLIFSDGAFDALKRMDEKGDIEVHFSTNSLASTRSFYTYALSRKQRMAMVMNGLRIHELRPIPADAEHFCGRYEELLIEEIALGEEYEPYDKQMFMADGVGPQFGIHSKTAIIDGELAIIGSHNFDPRSEMFNTEAAVVLYGAEIVAAVEEEVRRYMDNRNSWTVAPRKRIPVWREFTGIIGSISRTLPIFDLWPFHYTAAFDLKEGYDPVPIDDPRFYDSYVDVGELPTASWGWKRFKTSLFGAFGGVTTPIM